MEEDLPEADADAEFIKSELTHFVEYEFVSESIQIFCGQSWESAWDQKWESVVVAVSKYQEQSTLLNPHLESLVTPICTQLVILMESFGVFEKQRPDQARISVSKQFHALCKVLQVALFICENAGF